MISNCPEFLANVCQAVYEEDPIYFDAVLGAEVAARAMLTGTWGLPSPADALVYRVRRLCVPWHVEENP